jgi:DNA-binding NtrC family response regulator
MPERGSETILIVDDEPVLRSMAEIMLTRYGYQAITVGRGEEVLRVLDQQPHLRIDLAVLDVVMPDMSGPELAVEIQRMRPGLRILFITGYPDQYAALAERNFPVLTKPFTSVRLIRKVREVLDKPQAASSSGSR